jgi:para-aminobenzoate synthetase/4-amino-4-deoxychorismate lyase
MRTARPEALVQDGTRWLRFGGFTRELACHRPADVAAVLRDLESGVEDGLYAAGFLCYEAGAAFGLPGSRDTGALPLVWFGLYEWVEETGAPRLDASAAALPIRWQPGLDREEYVAHVERIAQHISAGDTYQVNFTFPLVADFEGDPTLLFARLVTAMQPRHAAYLDLGRYVIASVSPELFFERDGNALVTRPMKGTATRGSTPADDDARAHALAASEKDRAENIMVVDMLRNDLGKVAATGSVRAAPLFEVERYPTLFQMTSTVSALSDAPLGVIIRHLFPCASITGAPKHRTMEIIESFEREPRGIYTGAIGFVCPGGRASFNVAIRTVLVDRDEGRARYGVGSGIVADSLPEHEYRECLLKAAVLDQEPFRLLETLLWTPGTGYVLLEEHLARLTRSASYFGTDAPVRALAQRALESAAPAEPVSTRVRLLVDLAGRCEVETSRLGNAPGRLRVALAQGPIDSSSPWLYHKTTRRQTYAAALAGRPDCDDVLLWNERGEVTESTRANLVVDGEEGPLTPPVESGLLPGTFRARLLAEGGARERVLTIQDLDQRRIRLINSVWGWMDIDYVP